MFRFNIMNLTKEDVGNAEMNGVYPAQDRTMKEVYMVRELRGRLIVKDQ